MQGRAKLRLDTKNKCISVMQKKIVVKTRQETEASVEDLYILIRLAFLQWKEAGLDNTALHISLDQFCKCLVRQVVFVAQDEATGELQAMHTLRLNKRKGRADGANLAVSPKAKHEGIASRMLEEEVQRLRKAGYRYMMGSTGIPATWSVRWHLKNGYRIVGYSRSERNNYDSYVFRKQIATDVWHHPTDLLWTRPIAPMTAKISYTASYIATSICKTRDGHLNRIGRMAKKILKR